MSFITKPYFPPSQRTLLYQFSPPESKKKTLKSPFLSVSQNKWSSLRLQGEKLMSEPLGLQSPEWRQSGKEKVKWYTYRLALMLPFCLCPEHMEAETLASQSQKCGSAGSRQLARVVSRVLLPLETGQLAGSPRSTVPISTSLGYSLFFPLHQQL